MRFPARNQRKLPVRLRRKLVVRLAGSPGCTVTSTRGDSMRVVALPGERKI